MFVISSRIERYFLLDHGRQVMLIYKTNDLNQGATASIEYGSIISVFEPEAKVGQLMERWGFGFRLETKERWFQLFAVCEDEYKLWVHTLKWILHRNNYSRLFKNGLIDNNISARSAMKEKEKPRLKIFTDEEDSNIFKNDKPRLKEDSSRRQEEKKNWMQETTDNDEEVKHINDRKTAREDERQTEKKQMMVKKESIQTLLS